ncbi:hypothetical protein BH09BAC1_BH09BAC1_02870 [soil metagenome]
MKFCPHCGSQLRSDQRFCVQCGNTNPGFSIPTPARPVQSVTPVYEPQPIETTQGHNGHAEIARLEAAHKNVDRELKATLDEVGLLRHQLLNTKEQHERNSIENADLRNQIRSLNAELAKVPPPASAQDTYQLKNQLDNYEKLFKDQKQEINEQKQALRDLNNQINQLRQPTALVPPVQPSAEPTKKSSKAWVVIFVIFLLAIAGAGGWFYYSNFLNGPKTLSLAEEELLLQNWSGGVSLIKQAEGISQQGFFDLTASEKTYLNNLKEYLRIANNDMAFIRGKFNSNEASKPVTMDFIIKKVADWPLKTLTTTDFAYFHTPTHQILRPFILLSDSVYLLALKGFVEEDNKIKLQGSKIVMDNPSFGYNAQDLSDKIIDPSNKTLGLALMAEINERAKGSVPSKPVPPTTVTTGTIPADPVKHTPIPGATKPMPSNIKSDLIGHSMSDWQFKSLAQFQAFKITNEKPTSPTTMQYSAEATLKDSDGELFKARFDIYYTKVGTSWKLQKVLQTYFDYL